jgi:hypothetical protein
VLFMADSDTGNALSPRTSVSRRQAVAQLVEELGYKPAGRGLDSRWCRWNFSLT